MQKFEHTAEISAKVTRGYFYTHHVHVYQLRT